jgi:methionine-rich copper-binding protein CopC
MSRLGVVVAMCLLALSVPAPAWAHASLVSTDPTAGGEVGARPDAVTLRFSEAVDPPVDVVVTGPTGQRVSVGRTAVFGDRVTQRLLASPTGSGDYTISYQVLSSDGHVVNGTAHFTVSGGGGPSSADAASGGARPSVVVLGLAFLLLLVLGLTGAARVAEVVDD